MSKKIFPSFVFCYPRLLKPTESQQNEALIAAISEILWNIGEKGKVIIALTGETNLVPHSHTYFQDSVTEKVNCWDIRFTFQSFLQLLQTWFSRHQLLFFEFTKLEDLEIFLKRYLHFVIQFFIFSWLYNISVLKLFTFTVYRRSRCWGTFVSL